MAATWKRPWLLVLRWTRPQHRRLNGSWTHVPAFSWCWRRGLRFVFLTFSAMTRLQQSQINRLFLFAFQWLNTENYPCIFLTKKAHCVCRRIRELFPSVILFRCRAPTANPNGLLMFLFCSVALWICELETEGIQIKGNGVTMDFLLPIVVAWAQKTDAKPVRHNTCLFGFESCQNKGAHQCRTLLSKQVLHCLADHVMTSYSHQFQYLPQGTLTTIWVTYWILHGGSCIGQLPRLGKGYDNWVLGS